MSRTGKIACLPQPLREELNHRLLNGELARNLADWLNRLPEVTDLLAARFGSRPISEQNLSDWRNGGLVEWQLHRELLAGATACAQASADYAACGVSAKHFLAILNAHFASNLQSWDGGFSGEIIQNLRTLKSLYATVLSVRRSEQHDDRLALDRERLEFTRGKESPRPRRKPKSPSSTLARVSTETPPTEPPVPPPPDSLPQALSIPSISSTLAPAQSPAPDAANSAQNISPSPLLSKPTEPHAQQPASPSPVEPVAHDPLPAPAPNVPADFDWSEADWNAYDYPG